MPANITDKFRYASNGTAPLPSTLTSAKAVGAASLSVTANTGWTTATPMDFKLYQATVVNGILTVTPGTETIWIGIVSGLNVTNLTLKSGTDQVYPIGSIIEPMPTSGWADDFIGAMLAQHSQSGAHTNITATSITSTGNYTQTAGTVTLPDGVIMGNALSTSTNFLGYSQITSVFSTASTTATQVTGLSQTVTVPTGGRRVKITAYSRLAYNTTAGGVNSVEIWDGAVGTGTLLNGAQSYSPAASTGEQAVAIAFPPAPAAGSKTYNVSLRASTGTASMDAGTGYPAYILVELV